MPFLKEKKNYYYLRVSVIKIIPVIDYALFAFTFVEGFFLLFINN